MNLNDLKDLPKNIPVLPVRDLVIFPYMILPLQVGRLSSIKAVEAALENGRYLFITSQKNHTINEPQTSDLYEVGTLVMVMRMRKLPNNHLKILIQGVAKGRITQFTQEAPCFAASLVNVPEEESAIPTDTLALCKTVKEKLEKVIALGCVLSPDLLLILDEINDPSRLSDLIASNLNLSVDQCQPLLEETNPYNRLAIIDDLLNYELDRRQEQAKTSSKKNEDKESFLKNQIRSLQNENVAEDSKNEALSDLKVKILSAGMNPDAENVSLKQLARLEKMHPDSSEASMIRNYLDVMVELPWNISTTDSIQLTKAQEVLDNDHFGLEKAKERIIEFLAVRKLKMGQTVSGPILCFVGPPGVGKTSLGKSIAKSIGRKYHRLSLGGIKDEAEIRGHRRTYVGAMPGKIIQALKQTKTNNPVIVLDEIDKLGSDYKGDPSAAMLEVLDPEQNSTFRDNYLNVDFDLSNILFLATANILSEIPPALRDRMEVIHLSGYTLNDKMAIAKNYLVDRQITENGITNKHINFTDDGLKLLIQSYTREAGLRGLSREIGSICRKVAKKVVCNELDNITINDDSIIELLGSPKILPENKLKKNYVGITTGLAWTQSGGEILYVEAIKMKGKGGLVLTGQLGDVMQESARAALSYAKANHISLNIAPSWFDKHEIHVHFPAGAVPKDGPSAGVTIATSLVSVMTNIPVRNDIAMTGELTLSGRVLPVGGIKEKVLAALNQGITTLIVPLANKNDVNDIPEDLKKTINFCFCRTP